MFTRVHVRTRTHTHHVHAQTCKHVRANVHEAEVCWQHFGLAAVLQLPELYYSSQALHLQAQGCSSSCGCDQLNPSPTLLLLWACNCAHTHRRRLRGRRTSRQRSWPAPGVQVRAPRWLWACRPLALSPRQRACPRLPRRRRWRKCVRYRGGAQLCGSVSGYFSLLVHVRKRGCVCVRLCLFAPDGQAGSRCACSPPFLPVPG